MERVMDREMTEFLDGVVGVVEANSFEQHMLWSENRQRTHPRTWEQLNPGLLETVGVLDGRPVCVSLHKVRVGGHLILFVDATSQVVDHEMIARWMADTMPRSALRENGIVNRTDAMNFHNVFPR
jgi:hypothetical protein